MELNLNCFCCCCSIVVMTQVFLLLFSHRRNLIYIEREMKKKIRGGGGRDWREMVRVRLLVRWFLAGKRRRWREREETWGGFPAVVLAVGGVGKEDATVGFGYPSGPRTNLRVFFFNEIYFQHRELIARDMHLIISPFFFFFASSIFHVVN